MTNLVKKVDTTYNLQIVDLQYYNCLGNPNIHFPIIYNTVTKKKCEMGAKKIEHKQKHLVASQIFLKCQQKGRPCPCHHWK